jgi:hypothetical protein
MQATSRTAQLPADLALRDAVQTQRLDEVIDLADARGHDDEGACAIGSDP